MRTWPVFAETVTYIMTLEQTQVTQHDLGMYNVNMSSYFAKARPTMFKHLSSNVEQLKLVASYIIYKTISHIITNNNSSYSYIASTWFLVNLILNKHS